MSLPRLVLASTSPRRADLLRGLGLRPRIVAPGVVEDGRDGEAPARHALRLAETKARAGASSLEPMDARAVVLAADTVVAVDGTVLGKPEDARDAERMLALLRGRTHEVFTGVCLLRTDDGRSARAVEQSRVHFRSYDERAIRWYVSTREPEDKAGAYSIQGLGVLLARGIEGSWTNVVGLPLEILPALFAEVGVDLLDLLARDAGSGSGL